MYKFAHFEISFFRNRYLGIQLRCHCCGGQNDDRIADKDLDVP